MHSKYYFRDYNSHIWCEITFEYFCILKKSAYLTWWSHKNGIDRYEFCCDICGYDQYIEVVSGINDKYLIPEHISDKGYKYHD